MLKNSKRIFFFCIIFLFPTAPVIAAQWSLDQVVTSNSTLITQDHSADGVNLVLNNMSAASSIAGQSGAALNFNGRKQHASAADATSLQSASVAISAWIKPNRRSSFPDTGEWVASQADNFGLYLTENRRVAFYVKNRRRGWSDVFSPVNSYQFNEWQHITGTFNADNNVLKVYIDGVEVGSSPFGSGIEYSTGNGFSIGSMQGNRNFNGSIDEVGVFNSVLSQVRIKQLASVTGSTPPVVVTPSIPSTPPSNPTSPVDSITATGSSITKDIADARNLQSRSVTLSAWVLPNRRTSFPSTGQWVASQADNFGLYLTRNRRIAFYVKNSGSGWSDVLSPVNSYQFDQWQHISGSYNATTKVLKVYLNGKEVGSSPWGSGIGYTTGKDFTIGSMQGGRSFDGQVNKVTVFDRVLTRSNIRQLSSLSPVSTPTNPPVNNPTNNEGELPVISIDNSNKVLPRQAAAGTVVGRITSILNTATAINSRALNVSGTTSDSPEFLLNNSNEIILRNGVTLSDNQYSLEAIYSSDVGDSNKLSITISIINGFQGRTIKVIAFGDSLTDGASYSEENLQGDNVSANAVVPIDENNERPFGQSYRSSIARVQDDSDNGVSIDFIGTKIDDWGGDVEFDGWSGFTSTDLLGSPLTALKDSGFITQANVAFMTIGTNDAIEAAVGNSINTTQNLTKIITEMRTINPNLVFLLAQIIPFDPSNTTIFEFGLADGYNTPAEFSTALAATNTAIPAKNAIIGEVADTLSTFSSPVISVDMPSAFAGQEARLMSDGIHPNNVGEREMAKKWIEAIDPFFDGR